MESDKRKASRCVLLGRQHWDEPIRVQVRHYKRFSHKLDRQLQKLVDRWSGLAAPNALRRQCRVSQLWNHLNKLPEDYPEGHQADVE